MIQAVRAAIAQRIATTGLVAYADMVPNPVVPCAMIRPSENTYGGAGSTNTGALVFEIIVFATQGQTNWDVGQVALDTYATVSGVSSLQVAFAADPTLGGTVIASNLRSWRDYGISNYNGIEYFAVRFLLDVMLDSRLAGGGGTLPSYVYGSDLTSVSVANAAGTPIQMVGDTISLEFSVDATVNEIGYLGTQWRRSVGDQTGTGEITHEVYYNKATGGTYQTYMGRLGKTGALTWSDGTRTTSCDTVVARVTTTARQDGLIRIVATHRLDGAVTVT